MQKIISNFVFCCFAFVSCIYSSDMNAQQICPAPYSSSMPINFIRTWDATSPETDPNNLMIRPLKDVKQTTQFLDGLGRPIQTVVKRGSLVTGGSPNDFVCSYLYDPYGREVYRYLPFAANNAGGNASINDGFFKLNPFQQDSTFNKAMFTNESWYYEQTNFEASPLNRSLERFAAGDSWVGTSGQASEGNRHSNKIKYWVNTVTDSVRVWNVTDNTGTFASYSSSGMYPAGTLFKTVTTDEHNNQAIEFTDKDGNIILRKMQLTSAPDTGMGKGHYGWICTYYIYDELSNLRCVVQPRGVELISSTWTLTDPTILSEQCFRFEYDKRQRRIMKQIPGAGAFWMVYDARDRLVLSQDSSMRAAHQWLYTQYDALNREIATGTLSDNNNLTYHASRADTSIAYPAAGAYIVDTLGKTFYDDYGWRGGQGNPLSSIRNNSYDSYLQAASNSTWPYPQDATVQTNQLNGMVTGAKVKVLGTSSTYLYCVRFYDVKGRVIQIQSQNITTGTDIITTQYTWTNRPVTTIAKNEKTTPNAQTSIILTQITYDSIGRGVKVENKVSNTNVNGGAMPGSWHILAQNEYDALGQLTKEKLGALPLDSLVYEYNIRGWMLGMNRSYVKDTTSVANLFGFDLGYDRTNFTVNGNTKSYNSAQYNGNIGGLLWKSTGDDQLRKYDFAYDAVDRLTSADFNQLTNNSFSKDAKIDFSVYGLTYDANGNIQSMNQKGWKIGGSVTIDSLLYTYMPSSNKLLNVIDRKNDSLTRLGDFRTSVAYLNALNHNKTISATDYSFDGNGNTLIDNNKDISSIHYNLLNLPDSIVITNKGIIKYVYNAVGDKLKKITSEGSKVTTTLYLFGTFINDTLQFLPHENGRIRYDTTGGCSLQYDYFIRDHLGNIRLIVTDQQQSDAYPACTMELVDSTINNKYYSNVTITRSGLPSGYPVDNSYSNPNQYLSKVTGSGNKIGSAIILRVMAGDKFNLRVSSWYKKNGATPQTPNNPLYDLINALTNNIGNIPTSHGTVNELVSNNSLNPGALSFYALHNSADSTTKPKAFINWVLFDEQFNYVSANSGFEQVGGDNTLTVHTRNNQAINKNGYLYIYVSNETPNIDVYFDNLQVTQVRGPLLEETHYYPFGLAMNGISSIASKNQYPENKYKFNSGTQLADKEFSDGIGLNIYETPFRGYDPQIGRFQQADPLAEISNEWSPYSFCLDNPVLLIDPLGLSSGPGPETSTKSKPKLLGGVTVTGYRKKSLIVLLQDNTLPINNQPKGTPHVPLPPPTTNAKTSGTDIAGAGAIALTAEESAGVSIGVTVGSAATGGLVLFVWYLTTIAGPHEGHPMLPRPGFAIRDQTYIPSTVVLPMSYAIPNTGTPPRAIPKPILMPFSEQYALRARTNGWYPNYVWGKGQVAPVYLHRGDIWKIGTSMAGSKRYLESFYDNIGAGLDYDREFGPAPLDQVLFMEILKLSQYKTTHNGEFPPGNTKWQ